MTCSVDGCESPVRARNWCNAHYLRWCNHGDPLGGKPSPKVRKALDHADGTRTCATCGNQKSIADFHKDKSGSQGRKASCKACVCGRMKSYYQDNRDERKSRVQQYRDSNADIVRKRDTARYYRDREKRLALVEASNHRRRQREKEGGRVPGITLHLLRSRHGDLCRYCGVTMSFIRAVDRKFIPDKATIEHIVPVSQGGLHDWDNTALCCWRCNLRKNAKSTETWMAAAGWLTLDYTAPKLPAS